MLLDNYKYICQIKFVKSFRLTEFTPDSCIAASTGCEADVILVIDKSGSMRSYYTELLEFCKKLVTGLDRRSRIGIVVFNHIATTEVSGTTLRNIKSRAVSIIVCRTDLMECVAEDLRLLQCMNTLKTLLLNSALNV